jgi:hypothetical protein
MKLRQRLSTMKEGHNRLSDCSAFSFFVRCSVILSSRARGSEMQFVPRLIDLSAHVVARIRRLAPTHAAVCRQDRRRLHFRYKRVHIPFPHEPCRCCRSSACRKIPRYADNPK